MSTTVLETAVAHHIEPGQVLDIGGRRMTDTLMAMMEKTFLVTDDRGRRLLPPALLSDETGLRIWRDITRLPNYYQTREEISLLETHGKAIASHITSGCTLIDLGCGDIRKIKPLLDTLEAACKPVHYYALDLSQPVLIECLARLSSTYHHVQCSGLWGTFADCLRWASHLSGPKFFLSLGSIYGNDRFDSAVSEFRKWSHTLGKQDKLLIGVDAKSDPETVWNSYHDEHGVMERFQRNALEHSNRVLGVQWYKSEDWEVDAVMEREVQLHHRFVFRALRGVRCEKYNLVFEKGDEIDCYEVFKNGPEVVSEMVGLAGLRECATWAAPSGGGTFHEYLLVSSQV